MPRPPDPNFHDILEYLRKDADGYGRMDERIEILETSVSKLERILISGAGEQTALIHQVMEIKLNLSALKETVVTNETNIRTHMQETIETKKFKMQVTTAVIIALISAVASMVSAYISMRGR